MIDSIFKMAGAALTIVSVKLQRKYKEKWLRLEKEHYEESNKPYDKRDHAKLDNIEKEVNDLALVFSDEIFKK